MAGSKVSFKERIIAFGISFVLMLVTCVIVSIPFVLVFRRELERNPEVFGIAWKVMLALSFLVALAGFVAGMKKTSEFFGFLWGTNKPKNGNWL